MIKEELQRTLICDRCKKEVSQFDIGFKVSFPVKSWDGSTWASDDRRVELCTQCTKELKNFLDNGKIYNDRDEEMKEILEDNDELNKWIDKLRAENEKLKNAIEEAIKDHCLFRQNEVIDFTSKCVWEALNPDTKMCVPNAMFIKIEELLKDYIEKELAK